MKINLRPYFQSNRRFYFTLSVLFLLLIGVVASFEIHSLRQITEFIEGNIDENHRETCRNVILELTDYSWETFRPQVNAVNAASVRDISNDSLHALLERLAELPGVRRAYCLQNGDQLSASSFSVPAGMADVLARQRQTFVTYFQGCKRPTEKFDSMILSRVRFADVPVGNDTLRMILGAFDRNGTPIHILPELASDPSLARYVIALEMDPNWIRRAVAAQMDDIYHSRWSFILWSPPPFDTTGKCLQGLGVIALGDTIWWRGPKTADPGLVAHWTIAEGIVWLEYVAVYQEDLSEVAGRTKYFHNYYLLLGAVAAAALFFTLLLVSGIIFLRKQWLARQTALSHLAHAIRTPVARLRLDVDTLQEKRSISPEEETELVQSIGTECGRIERAVQNASLSLNGNGHSSERTPGDLSHILKDALRPWEGSFKLAGVGFESPRSLPSLPGLYDREMIVTLLDNLLDNALRHTRLSQQKNPRQMQTVAVSVREESGFALLAVEDSDGGVPAADRQRIFKRFERGSDPALTAVSGLGLGLALVKEIAEAHGGSVSVDDSPLGGARFHVALRIGKL